MGILDGQVGKASLLDRIPLRLSLLHVELVL
jgi:hypothetical protein